MIFKQIFWKKYANIVENVLQLFVRLVFHQLWIDF
jgi:hypothetical protein